MRKQFHAGYILSPVKHQLSSLDKPIFLDDLLHRLSCFFIEYDFKNTNIVDPVVAVVDNIISRGLPTFPSLFIEDTFSNAFDLSEKTIHEKIGQILYKETDSLQKIIELVYESLFTVEPRFEISASSFDFDSWDEMPGSKQEEHFFVSTVPQNFHPSYCQLVEPQKRIIDILHYSNSSSKQTGNNLINIAKQFHDQKVDFCFDFPVAINNADCMGVEIDGPHHLMVAQKIFDNKRDGLLKELGWAPTVRLDTSQLNQITASVEQSIHDFLTHPYAQQIKDNFIKPIWEKGGGIEAIQIALSPFAIARVQKAILFLIQNGILNLDDQTWELAFIERDMPCASLAIEDLKGLFNNLFELEGQGRSLPDIKFVVYVTDEFMDCKLNDQIQVKSLSEYSNLNSFSAVIDVSILQRIGFDYPKIDEINSNNYYLKIRSCHSINSDRKIQSAKPIKYFLPSDEIPEALLFFLRNIFRKQNFLPGQVRILQRSLSLSSVIALLPTGAGKSLTYQLSALLQPGIVLIVDPLISLMRDQNDNLREAGIDSTTFINSTITAQERNERSKKLVEGNYQFVFISPERLQIDEFRQYLLKMKEIFFTYGIVDEAHCVSEWGHDFRTAYLRLGENIRKYCYTPSEEIPIMALTGTASFDVLADVQRELMIADETSIIAPTEYARKELNFQIIEVIPDEVLNDRIPPTEKSIKEQVSNYKINALSHILYNDIPEIKWGNNFTYRSLEDFFSRDESYPNSGIVFCPHINWVFGVIEVAKSIKNNIPFLENLIAVYAGGLGNDGLVDLEQVQSDFKKDKVGLLIATKAFGMGIDKPNIRFTIHFNMPQSIESFYQEAGRAGRDKELAKCYILYSPTKVIGRGDPPSVDKDLMLTFHHKSFQGKDKEILIISELLNEIFFPSVTVNTLLADVKNKIDQEISFNLYPKENPLYLYINADFPKSYGSINIYNLSIRPEPNKSKSILNPSESASFIATIKQEIMKLCPENVSLPEWLTNPGSIGPQPGIEIILNNLVPGESKQLIIGFENNRIQKIENFLSDNGFGFYKNLVRDSSNYCFSGDEFLDRLSRKISQEKQRRIIFSEEHEIVLKELFNQIRNDQDTYKAIYRLSVIGLIDDFVIDYNAKSITVIISKKDEQSYVDNLTEYIGRYVSAEEKSRTPDLIKTAEGSSIIQKCCSYLVGFVYEKIAAKRKEAINVMESTIQAGVGNDKLFADLVHSYFDSKYTPELRKYLYDYSIDLVWEYMNITDNDPDAVSHLRGACDRLLVENPQNGALLLLRSYAKFITQTYDKKEALDDFRKGWQHFREKEGISRRDYLEYLSIFYEKTIRNDTSIKNYLDVEIFQEHYSWLMSFNKTFLKDIEYV